MSYGIKVPVLLVLLLAAACDGPWRPAAPLPVAMVLSTSDIHLQPGDTVRIGVEVLDQYGERMQAPVTWVSRFPEAIAVSPAGTVTAVRTGSGWVVAEVAAAGITLRDSARVSIVSPTSEQSAIIVVPSTVRIAVGDSLVFQGVASGRARGVQTWSAADSSVMTLRGSRTLDDGRSEVIGIARRAGATTVTVHGGNGYAASASVTVQ